MYHETILRPMQDSDLDGVCALQVEAYLPHFHESRDAFAAKRRFYPAGAWVAADGDRIVGYFFSHPWRRGEPAPLDAAELTLNIPADAYYLHDISIAKSHQGRKLAAAFITRGDQLAAGLGLRYLAMTSVQGSRKIWEKYGYEVTALNPAGALKLQDYGQDAVYLEKIVGKQGIPCPQKSARS